MKSIELTSGLESLVPRVLAESWDNCGLMVGDPDTGMTGIILALDYHPAVLAVAIERGCNFIFTHHPLIFSPVKSIDAGRFTGRAIYELVRHGITLFAAHTNLDSVEGGVNDCLAAALGIVPEGALSTGPFDAPEKPRIGLGRYGTLDSPVRLCDFVGMVKSRLGVGIVKLVGDPGRTVRRVAVCGGSGGGMIKSAAAVGADVLVTGDLGYHSAQEAERLGMAAIDASHYFTELVALEAMEGLVSKIPGTEGLRVERVSGNLNAFSYV